MHLIIPKQIYGSKYGTTCHSISLLLCSTHALSHRPPFKKLTFFSQKKYMYIYFLNIPFQSQYIHQDYKLLATLLVLGLIHVITSWLVWAQIKCGVHVVQLKRTSFNQFRKTKIQALRVYCSNIYCGFSIAADNMVGRKKNYRDIYFQRQNLLYQNSLMTFSSHIFYLKQFFQFAEIELFVKKVGYICQFFFS